MTTDTRDRIFSGVYPGGIVWADRHNLSHGDYKRLAFLDFETLALDVEADCPDELRAAIAEDAQGYQVRAGEAFKVSTAGQTVTLGWGLSAGAKP